MRLQTKEQRLKAQANDFLNLIADGYHREDYKQLIFWVKEGTQAGKIIFGLKVYKTNAAHALEYRYYRSEEARSQVKAYN